MRDVADLLHTQYAIITGMLLMSGIKRINTARLYRRSSIMKCTAMMFSLWKHYFQMEALIYVDQERVELFY